MQEGIAVIQSAVPCIRIFCHADAQQLGSAGDIFGTCLIGIKDHITGQAVNGCCNSVNPLHGQHEGNAFSQVKITLILLYQGVFGSRQPAGHTHLIGCRLFIAGERSLYRNFRYAVLIDIHGQVAGRTVCGSDVFLFVQNSLQRTGLVLQDLRLQGGCTGGAIHKNGNRILLAFRRAEQDLTEFGKIAVEGKLRLNVGAFRTGTVDGSFCRRIGARALQNQELLRAVLVQVIAVKHGIGLREPDIQGTILIGIDRQGAGRLIDQRVTDEDAVFRCIAQPGNHHPFNFAAVCRTVANRHPTIINLI